MLDDAVWFMLHASVHDCNGLAPGSYLCIIRTECHLLRVQQLSAVTADQSGDPTSSMPMPAGLMQALFMLTVHGVVGRWHGRPPRGLVGSLKVSARCTAYSEAQRHCASERTT